MKENRREREEKKRMKHDLKKRNIANSPPKKKDRRIKK